MSQILSNVKDLEVDDPGNSQGFLDKLPFFKNMKNSVDRLVTRYEKVQVQIDRIEAELDKARMSMLKDIGMFDVMYEKNLEYFHELKPLYCCRGRKNSRAQGNGYSQTSGRSGLIRGPYGISAGPRF